MGVLSYSIHVQVVSHNQSLLSLIQNQIITKRVTEEEEKRKGIQKNADNDNNDGKYVNVSPGVLSYSIHIQFFSQNQYLLSPNSNQIIIKRVIY